MLLLRLLCVKFILQDKRPFHTPGSYPPFESTADAGAKRGVTAKKFLVNRDWP